VGLRSEALATELALTEQTHIDIDENGLSHCMQGKLSYQSSISVSRVSRVTGDAAARNSS
jgi:hypothetical protein